LKVSELKVPNLPVNLTLHGIGIYSDPSESHSVVSIHLVNHHPAGSRIEIIDHKVGESTAEYIESVMDKEHILTPNAVIALGKRTFYVTNDHTLATKGIGRLLEEFSFVPFGNVIYRDAKGVLR
jgi:hypothetical protein